MVEIKTLDDKYGLCAAKVIHEEKLIYYMDHFELSDIYNTLKQLEQNGTFKPEKEV